MATGKALNTESKKVISKTHAYHDTEEKMVHFYDELAPDYDDAVNNKYIGYRVAAEVLQKFVSSKTARILDVATGTGLVGVQPYAHCVIECT
ncbi:uncharacterized protein LOC117115819 isoform X3 [Anneissia japonica]|uniref:uncharacterized protein LOC117115819 isoform X3 n=1 Tax=Anneissia japonica TaxID=1529436 RepID=UPI001425B32D|nr:uncharacterized protein LOC117115819 isoform X3 [Anneissia japonica]